MAGLNLVVEPGRQEIIGTWEFDAPRDLVFKAFTDPKAIPQWWGPRGLTTTVDKMDVRKGGMWRFVQRDESGEYAFNGVYHLVTPERMVYTFEWEGLPGHILLETVTLEERGGRTIMTDQSVFQSVADRDGMVANGMEEGGRQTMERFAELLERLRK